MAKNERRDQDMATNSADKQSIFRIYEPNFIEDMLLKFSKQDELKRFMIPLEFIGESDSSLAIPFIRKQIELFYKKRNRFIQVRWYNEKNSLWISEYSMDSKDRTFEFPYEEYDQFMPAIKAINDCEDLEMLLVFVNNVPYSLEAGIIVSSESDKALEKASTIAFNHHMKRNNHLSMNEIIHGIKDRQYNLLSLTPKESLRELQQTIAPLFLFPPRTQYEKEGYHVKERQKPKFFVSYSHKNKNIVRKIISQLRDYGLDFWLDEEQIDVGDRLLERVDEGMRECDIPIVFISRQTKTSMFAKHELYTFFSKIIYQNSTAKKWVIVRLDDVNPNEIVQGLGDFLYITYDQKDTITIYNALKQKLERMQKKRRKNTPE